MQRRLGAEGLRFREVVDDLRRELAERWLLQGGNSLAEIAFLLGYADQSALQRAFRRWHGTTPAAWRDARA